MQIRGICFEAGSSSRFFCCAIRGAIELPAANAYIAAWLACPESTCFGIPGATPTHQLLRNPGLRYLGPARPKPARPRPAQPSPAPKHERPTDTGGPFQLLQRRRSKEHTPPKFFGIATTYISSSSLSGSGPAIISSATLSVRARIASSRRSDISGCSVR